MILSELNAIRAKMLSLQSFLREGRVGGLYWANFNLKDLKDSAGGPDVIRKEAWSFYITISGVRLYWGLQEPEETKGGKGPHSPR